MEANDDVFDRARSWSALRKALWMIKGLALSVSSGALAGAALMLTLMACRELALRLDSLMPMAERGFPWGYPIAGWWVWAMEMAFGSIAVAMAAGWGEGRSKKNAVIGAALFAALSIALAWGSQAISETAPLKLARWSLAQSDQANEEKAIEDRWSPALKKTLRTCARFKRSQSDEKAQWNCAKEWEATAALDFDLRAIWAMALLAFAAWQASRIARAIKHAKESQTSPIQALRNSLARWRQAMRALVRAARKQASLAGVMIQAWWYQRKIRWIEAGVSDRQEQAFVKRLESMRKPNAKEE